VLVGLFGTGRNGSTLLGRLLDGSPELWVHPVEVNYLAVFSDLLRFGHLRRRTTQNAVTDPLSLDGALSLGLLRSVYEYHLDEIAETYAAGLEQPLAAARDPLAGLEGDSEMRPADFLPRLLEAGRAAYDGRGRAVTGYAFKTIETPYVDDYARTFPTMRFIHLLRDPLATYSSLKRTNMVRKNWPFWAHGGDELRMLLEQRWLPHARFAVEHAPQDPARHFVVRHEDVVASPVATIESICTWLAVSPPGEPDVQTVLGGLRMTKLPMNPSRAGVDTPARVVGDMSTTYGYDEVLTRRERDFIVARTRDLAGKLGYDLSGGSSRLGLAVRWLPPDHWEIANSRSPGRSLGAILARRRYIYGALLNP
jgi:hypothetical protein